MERIITANGMRAEIIYYSLPDSINGFITQKDELNYIIVVNSGMPEADQEKTIAHEIRHMVNHDFDRTDADHIEAEAHSWIETN